MIKLFQGDCLELMEDVPTGSIDMILCDLPYGTTACKWDTIIPFDRLWEQYKRIIKDNGAIVLTASQPFTSALVMSNPKMFKYSWVWDKRSVTGFLNSKKRPLVAHEDIIVFSKKQVLYNPQMHEDRKPRGFKGKVMNPGTENYGSQKKYISEVDTNSLAYPKSVLTIVRQPNNSKEKVAHPTQKPVALFEYLIKTYTNEGDTVLDNCAGSGTTGVACMNLNRNCILMEKEPKYVDIIDKRLEDNDVLGDYTPLRFTL